MKFYVYQLRKEGELQPFYIGKGCGSRLNDHLKPSRLKDTGRKSAVIRGAIKKGISIVAEKISTNLTEPQAMLIERQLISIFGRLDLGTGILANMTDGGDGVSGYRPSLETRNKLSIANTGKTWSAESKAKVSATRTGVPMPPVTQETRNNMRAGRLAQPKFPCVHCGKMYVISHLKQWHGDKCKMKK